MKKLLLIGGLLCMGGASLPAQNVTPYELKDIMILRLSTDGKYAMGQTMWGSATLFDMQTLLNDQFTNFYPGGGYSLADNGMIVGQSMTDLKGAILKGADGVIPASLESAANSCLESITPDGTRACGWIASEIGYAILDLPMIVEIDAEGNVGEPIILPYPTKDFFGQAPQFVTCALISADGKTGAGTVMDSTGFYSYPIVFQEDENGEWSYVLPTEPMFNPNNLPIPEWPDSDFYAPLLYNYLDPEYQELWNEYKKEGYTDADLTAYFLKLDALTDEQYAEYMDALAVYNEQLQDFYDLIDQYWRDMAKLAKGANFSQGAYALSPNGDTLLASAMITDDSDGTTDIARGYTIYEFNLKDNTYAVADSKLSDVIPYQILADGTVIAISPFTYAGYIRMPGSGSFITLEAYLEANNPGWLPWLKENYTQQGTMYNPETGKYEVVEYIQSGIISMSQDRQFMAGGLNYNDYVLSYIFGIEDSGVEGLEADIWNAEKFTVYNLHGMKVMETADKANLSTLAKGIYIVNGKKIAIK